MTFSKMASEYLKHITIRRGCSTATASSYDETYKQFVTHLQSSTGVADDVKHFTPDVVEAFVQKYLDAGKKASSVNTRLSHLASIAKWAMTVKHGRGYLLAENPLVRIERPKKVKPKEKYLT